MSRARLTLATAAAAALLLLVGAAGAAALPFGGPGSSEPRAASPGPAAPTEGAVPEGVSGGVLKVGGDVSEPVVLSRVPPDYPEEARKNKVQGIVKLSAVVDEKGIVAKVEPIESPDPALTQAAADAVKKWTYRPATRKGKPVKVRMTITVNFRLA